MEHDYSQFLFARLVFSPFSFLHALLLDLPVRNGSLMLAVVYYTRLRYCSIGQNMNFHANLTFFINRCVDLLNQSARASSVTDSAAGTTAFARSKARTGASAYAGA